MLKPKQPVALNKKPAGHSYSTMKIDTPEPQFWSLQRPVCTLISTQLSPVMARSGCDWPLRGLALSQFVKVNCTPVSGPVVYLNEFVAPILRPSKAASDAPAATLDCCRKLLTKACSPSPVTVSTWPDTPRNVRAADKSYRLANGTALLSTTTS